MGWALKSKVRHDKDLPLRTNVIYLDYFKIYWPKWLFESMDGFGWLQNLLSLKMSWIGNTVSVGYHSQAWQIFIILGILKLKPGLSLVSMYL